VICIVRCVGLRITVVGFSDCWFAVIRILVVGFSAAHCYSKSELCVHVLWRFMRIANRSDLRMLLIVHYHLFVSRPECLFGCVHRNLSEIPRDPGNRVVARTRSFSCSSICLQPKVYALKMHCIAWLSVMCSVGGAAP